MSATVLIVDDEKNILVTLARSLEIEGYACEVAGGTRIALEKAAERPVDLVLLDVKLQDGDGLDVLARLRELRPEVPVLMMSGHGTIETAVRATRMGALDFLEKPIGRERLLLAVQNALKLARAEAEARELRAQSGGEMLGDSPPMRAIKDLLAKAGPSEGRVLITGENGTGKELIARAIHTLSRRAAGPFVKVNCAAIPAELIESELFGHEKGAFTGAVAARKGKFELADQGTLFLDEVGDAPPGLQAKLLRVLQDGEFERVGGTETLKVDVRVVSATNKDLGAEVEEGRFREDLYYRLAVVLLHSPPLRDRKGDILLLAPRFLEAACARNGRKPLRLQEGALAPLMSYDFPGNVRELRNLVERLAILADGPEVEAGEVAALLPAGPRGPAPAPEPGHAAAGPFRDQVAGAEREIILRTLAECGNNVAETARKLDLERSHLYKKMRALGIQPR